MKIFCTGLQRTGTTSVTEALTTLGFKTNHYPKGLRDNIEHEEIDLFDAFTDWPIPLLYQELDKRHPGSKFIHVSRNEEDWLKSVEWLFTVGAKKYNWPKSGPGIDLHIKFYGSNTFHRDRFLEAYRRHNTEVEKYFLDRPQDCLFLQLEEADKFEKICQFLSLPIPDMPFPCSNQRESAVRVQLHRLRGVLRTVKRKVLGPRAKTSCVV